MVAPEPKPNSSVQPIASPGSSLQPGGADGAHQGDQHRDPTLVAQPMQDQRYRQTWRGGRQLQQAMQRAGLRFAIAHTL